MQSLHSTSSGADTPTGLSQSFESNVMSPFLASPTSQLTTPVRSLFNFNVVPRTTPTSLFSVHSADSPLPVIESSLFSTPSTEGPHAAPATANSRQTTFFTPPSVRSDLSVVPSSPTAPRSLSLAERQHQTITPSPFKTPNSTFSQFPFSPLSSSSNSETSPTFQEPSPSTPVARVLRFEQPSNRSSIAKRPSSADSSEELSPPDPKRPAAPWTEEPSRRATNSIQQLATPTHEQARNFENNAQDILTPPPPSTPSMQHFSTTVLTPLLGATAMEETPNSAGGEPRRSAGNSPFAVPSLPERMRTNDSNTSALQKTPTLPMPALQVPSLHMAQFSSYNAALEAQSLLEDDAVDKISPEELREAFMIASGNMATALEDLVSQVTHTSDELHALNMNLQMCNNEVLLMNASLVTDDRLRALEEFFSRSEV